VDNHIKHEDWTSAICLLGYVSNPQPFIEKILAAGHIEQAMVLWGQKCSRKFQIKMFEQYAAHLIKTGRVQDGIDYYWDVLDSFGKAYTEMVNHDMLLDALVFAKLHRIDGNTEADALILKKFVASLDERTVPSSTVAKM